MFDERPLQRLSSSPLAKPSTVLISFAACLNREHQTRANRRAIDQHGAGAAHAVFAADMRAGLAAIVADDVDQCTPRLDPNGVALAVDGQRDLVLLAHGGFFLACRSAARMRCGVAGISLMLTPKGVSASLIALRTAAGAPIAPPSPRPFDFVIVASLSVSKCNSSIGGISRQVGGRKSASVTVSMLPVSS